MVFFLMVAGMAELSLSGCFACHDLLDLRCQVVPVSEIGKWRSSLALWWQEVVAGPVRV